MDRPVAPFPVGMDDHLAIRPGGMEPVAAGFQHAPQFRVVVNLSVVGEPYRGGLIAHWLSSGRAKVDDGEPAVTERDGAIRRYPHPAPIRPAMSHPVAKLRDVRLG